MEEHIRGRNGGGGGRHLGRNGDCRKKQVMEENFGGIGG